MDLLKTEAYDYHLPENLIAQFPVEPRDSARMLVYNRTTKSIEHKIFSDIVDYLQAGDVLIINNTRVIPARLMGLKKETHASIEVLLLKRLNYTDWEVLMKPGKRAKIGTIIGIRMNTLHSIYIFNSVSIIIYDNSTCIVTLTSVFSFCRNNSLSFRNTSN